MTYTTSEIITEVTRYLYTTDRMRTDDLEHLVADTVEAISAHGWMISRQTHERVVDKAIEGALANIDDDEYWRGHDDGYREALADVNKLTTQPAA